jgi:tryptophan halogenase
MNFAIVGGGTAGWLTALYINRHFPNDSVTIVASSEIGILGAGEGTTPPFMDFLKEVGIEEKELIDNCKATRKYGIKFTNWNGDGDVYYHNFSEGLYALHFDASLLAKYLETVAISRGVNLIDDIVVSNTDTVLYTGSGLEVKYDFLFDCSGFKRVFLQNRVWNKYDMPCKRAIPFFIPHDNNFEEVTESIAMKYGWIWKIPVQGRYGCGYVFDSNMTTDEEAQQEVRDWLGRDIEFPRVFNFEAGSYEDVWVNNCLAVGLSANFIEPLEATSIWVQILTLKIFVEQFGNPNAQEKLNSDIRDINEDILSFLYLHYMTERKDTDFWTNFEVYNKMPEKLEDRLLGDLSGYNFNIFSDESWDAILTGTRIKRS